MIFLFLYSQHFRGTPLTITYLKRGSSTFSINFYRVVVVEARVDRFLVAGREPFGREDVVDVGVLLVRHEIPFDDGPD